MIIWDHYEVEDRIRSILRDVYSHDPHHHFGRPFLTAYQLAIEFNYRHPETVRAMGYAERIGGADLGSHTSLAQYLAGQLSLRIKNGQLPDIEGAFLSNDHLKDIYFRNKSETVRSSLTGSEYPLSMYRLKEN